MPSQPSLPSDVKSLERISADAIPAVSDDPDHLTEAEHEDLEETEKRIILRGKIDDIEQRKTLGKKIFVLVCIWIPVIFALLCLQGFGAYTGFSLPTSVLLAMIGS